MPRCLRRSWGQGVGFLWFDVLRIRRRVAMENIRACFPDWDNKRVEQTARRSLFEMGETLSEFPELAFISKDNLLKRVQFQNLHIVDEALQQKKGVLFLGLHLANGDYGIAALSALGYDVHLISKRFTSAWLDKLWFTIRGRFGTQFIAPRDSSYDILKALRKNGIVIFVLDQFMGPPLGVRTTFFGRPTGTAFGLALFARKTQAPVIPCYSHRKQNGDLEVHFLPPVPFMEKEDKNTTLQFMTQKYTDTIESIVRLYPEQWMWIHRRWKPFND
ncbi:MAG: lysophospholipid acyltransferase family protein [Bdellovibrionaceae bacterium]|nr:lysophospholipid acyltransferase family protein [Pseudobdellovibrionaceae bacterium]